MKLKSQQVQFKASTIIGILVKHSSVKSKKNVALVFELIQKFKRFQDF